MAYTTIDDPSAYFQAKTYSGNSVDNTAITNDGNSDLQPDLIWFKRRDTPADHFLLDSNRGVTKTVKSSSSDAEITTTSILKSFDTNGFTVGTNSNSNSSSGTYVAWQWKANGGTTVTNTDGSENSTVQANTDAGFSIVEITGTGANATYGHGLGVKPQIYLVKRTSATGSWVWLTSVIDGTHDYLYLNTTGTKNNSSYDQPTSSVFQYNDTSGATNIVYCFAEKQGFSKFGKYTGNGSSDGPFVYTGFKPAFVIVKNTSSTYNWRMNGPDGVFLSANTNGIVYDSPPGPIDRLSNGFKIRGGDDVRQSNSTFIYMAFAANPFITSTGIPTTAGSTGPAT